VKINYRKMSSNSLILARRPEYAMKMTGLSSDVNAWEEHSKLTKGTPNYQEFTSKDDNVAAV
jgi:hypothetical protein